MKSLTAQERRWVFYDIGNSAFVLLCSTIIPIYFKNLADTAGITEANSTAYIGYATAIATLIIAMTCPLLGTVADIKGYKKRLFTFSMLLGVVGCASLALPVGWLWFLVIFIIAKVGLGASMVFYDAMLGDITTDDRMDLVSSYGYAWGYIGSCIPFIISLVFVLCSEQIGISFGVAMTIAFCLNAVWWFLVTIPLLKHYEQVHYIEKVEHPVKNSFSSVLKVMKEIRGNRKVFLFLIAFFFYIDGVYTIIDMATSYGKDMGINDTQLLLALLLTQVVAFPCSIWFGKLTSKVKSTKLIEICIIGYFCIVLFALQLDKTWEFWFLAVCVAVFQGTIQSLSRSHFAKLIPKEKSAEYFGFFDIFGKGATFLGILLMSVSTQIFQTSKAGVALLGVVFAIGYCLFRMAIREEEA